MSASAYVDSPVPTEQKSVVQSTVDTVKGYLGALSLGGGGGDKEGEGDSKEASTDTTEAKNAEEETKTGGVVASATAAASAATAAMVGSKESEGDKKEQDSSTTNDQTAAKSSSSTSASAAKDETMADAPPKDSRDADKPGDKNALTDEPGENASHAKKDNWPKENKSAIPTAGGERLGEKHWGESQIVPELPKKQEDGANVSSEEGQPDSKFRTRFLSDAVSAVRLRSLLTVEGYRSNEGQHGPEHRWCCSTHVVRGGCEPG